MKFGVRQICNVVFRATTTQKIGDRMFKKGQPVFYLDTAKTSSLEGSATSVYAQGGRGNARLISWEGEKTLTFTVEDALLSPISFAMLSGAGVVKSSKSSAEKVHFHQTTLTQADAITGEINLANALEPTDSIDVTAPLFIMVVDEAGDLTGEVIDGEFTLKADSDSDNTNPKVIAFNAGDKDKFTLTLPQADDFSDDPENATNRKTSKEKLEQKGNAGHYTYQFPYILNKNHTASRSYVQGWNDVAGNTGILTADSTTTSPQFAEPLQESYEADGTTITILAKGGERGDKLYIPSEVWNAIDEETGESLPINMPKYLTNPRLDGNTLKKHVPTNAVFTGGGTTNDITGSNTIFTVTGYKYYIQGMININKQWCTENFWSTISAVNSSSKTVELTFSYGNDKTVTVPVTYALKNDLLTYYFNKNKDRSYLSLYKQYKFFKSISDAKKTFENITQRSLMIDYYVIKNASTVTELQIDATNFGGYYYVEADTLFRRQIDGKDLPANLTFPNVKIQSNFTFSMSSSGDPSTFTFTMDAFPGYTYFDKTKKVLCAIQIADDKTNIQGMAQTVFPHKTGFQIEVSQNDSNPEKFDEGDGSTDI